MFVRTFVAVACFAWSAGALAADPAVKPSQPASPTIPVAHSALLTVDGAPTGDSLDLHIRRVSDKSLLKSEDVAVTVDGKNEPVTRDNNGSYQVPINDLRGDGAREVEIVVTHDGIKEILSGKVTVPDASAAGGLMRDHKQIAWWILNVVIVLIAAIALSRRKS